MSEPTPGEIVQDRMIEIAQAPKHEHPYLLTQAHQSFRAWGYTKGDLKDLLRQAMSVVQENRVIELSGDLVAELNAKYFILKSQSKVRIGQLEHRYVNGHAVQGLSLLNRSDFNLLMSNRLIAGVTADNVWVAHPERREYTGVFVDPEKPREYEGKLNLWAGFSVEPAKGPVYTFLRHVVRLSDHNRECANYILDWLAWGVQNPSRPIGTVIVFIGEQGTGKGTLGNCIRSIYGNHGTRAGKQEDLVGRFNAHLATASFCFIDEPPFAGNRGMADILKGLITEPTLKIEPKFQDSQEMDNMLKMMAATNHDWAMQVEFSDRRFCAISAPKALRRLPKRYWTRFHENCMTKSGKAAILHYLLNRDVSTFDAERDRPFTEAYMDQKINSLANDTLWWRLVIEQETFQVGRAAITPPDVITVNENGSRNYTKAGLYHTYAQWYMQTQRGAPVSKEVFWRNARKWAFTKDDFIRVGDKGDQTRVVTLAEWEELHQRLIAFLKDGQSDTP